MNLNCILLFIHQLLSLYVSSMLLFTNVEIFFKVRYLLGPTCYFILFHFFINVSTECSLILWWWGGGLE